MLTVSSLFVGGWLAGVGLFSVIMRDLANLSSDGPKWIVLDGDIDPMWIESLNTVMDDNKVLTLASNERIPLTPMMRLLFEISHLKTATPATVSRAGILYINPADLGWNPSVPAPLYSKRVGSGVVVQRVQRWTLRSVGRGFKSYSRQRCVTSLGKLFTPMCLSHQAV